MWLNNYSLTYLFTDFLSSGCAVQHLLFCKTLGYVFIKVGRLDEYKGDWLSRLTFSFLEDLWAILVILSY